MRRILSIGALLATLTVALTSCFVREHDVQCVPSATAMQGCVWIGEYRDTNGRVHAAHYRCPGTVDAY
jgi:hypothetical protein